MEIMVVHLPLLVAILMTEVHQEMTIDVLLDMMTDVRHTMIVGLLMKIVDQLMKIVGQLMKIVGQLMKIVVKFTMTVAKFTMTADLHLTTDVRHTKTVDRLMTIAGLLMMIVAQSTMTVDHPMRTEAEIVRAHEKDRVMEVVGAGMPIAGMDFLLLEVAQVATTHDVKLLPLITVHFHIVYFS